MWTAAWTAAVRGLGPRGHTADMLLGGSDGSVLASQVILATTRPVQNRGPVMSSVSGSVASGKVKNLDHICTILGIRNVVWEKISAEEPMIDTAETVDNCRTIGAALCIKILPTSEAFNAMF